ncbi:hypothetical protein [Bordetella hinzii]|uniref:Uncharacterized protein n=2 Tax=Bordetella hinzii TaxID=103855 RepID=A0AAN1RTM1_9BORD|nr:hypothetical protein [Bordetella hinzii]AKQ54332.1 hypothetical protein ACR54_00982 [Bordetella hinzii]AKQ58846.1 hypothetical protein ACR55_00940 [Bordetella hinzii]AZW15876.1 hypothetical protein CS347_03310 [Bordetella hinzii]KCB26016.1 hypothetical protein L544_3268 [Bordetella hinzii OH87 BAL007II]KCB31934.1 hypothetical protein L543_3114 [Bordetella hinzii L60]
MNTMKITKPTWRRVLPGAMLAMLVALSATPARADDHRYHRGGEYKQKYWDGACKVERKWKRNGEYKEKRKCQPAYVQPVYPQAVYPQPAYMAPSIVIQPPPIVIRP